MKEKIKSITVSTNPNYVIWEEDLTNIVRNTKLVVENGCDALYFVDGKFRNAHGAGSWLIKSKEEDKEQCKLQLICVNRSKTFDVCCGVGNVPFHDLEISYETVVGAHGECKVRIMQAKALYETLGHAPITADEIDEYVKLKLGEIMTTRLAEVLQNYDYNSIMTQQSVIAADLQKQFNKSLEDIGIDIVSFALAGFMFNADYQTARKEYFDKQTRMQEEREAARRREREQRTEIDNIIALTNATANLNVTTTPTAPAQPPQQNNTINRMVKYCPKCGTQVEKAASFCPNCGTKLS